MKSLPTLGSDAHSVWYPILSLIQNPLKTVGYGGATVYQIVLFLLERLRLKISENNI